MTTMDGNTQAQTEQPVPSAPEGSDPSQEVKITKAEWDRVNSLLGRIPNIQSETATAKNVQGEVAKLRDDIRPLLERAHLLGSQNKPLNDALNQIQTEQTDAEFRQAVLKIAQGMGSGTQPTGAGNAQGVDVAAVFGNILGQDNLKNPLIAPLLAKQYSSQAEAELDAYRVFHQLSTSPNPNPAQNPSLAGESAQRSATEFDALLAQYEEAFKNPTQNAARLEGLEKQMKDLGGYS